ncbi:hypothetical protein NQ314_007682 [Rhamnusium bicolor]|uniref:Transposase n=1 Tax=Rhamnusium bicolor TaxID=1586634 RepID=A0AAV8YJY5_9CUCU|nr:hypothetical protein NQ314_007682 [Rhamnusium bicolor]
MDYEKEQEYLRQLYDEVRSDSELELEPDDDDDSLADDEVEQQDHDTDIEQDIEDVSQEDISYNNEESSHRVPSFIGKDGKTKWRKHNMVNKRVRTRADNLVKHLPGTKAAVREKKSSSDIWSCFLTDEMLQGIVENTNIYIDICDIEPSNRTDRKRTF